jgi:hypothetical protein
VIVRISLTDRRELTWRGLIYKFYLESDMKWFSFSVMVLCMLVVATGCKKDEAKKGDKDKANTKVSAPAFCGTCGAMGGEDHQCAGDKCDKCGFHSGTKLCCTGVKPLCQKCGCCAGCDKCCKGETCEKCGFQTDTEVCCKGVAKGDALGYCSKCGEISGTEKCCDASAKNCDKCGMHAGSALCCKIKKDDDHDHKEGEHKEGEHKEGEGEKK